MDVRNETRAGCSDQKSFTDCELRSRQPSRPWRGAQKRPAPELWDDPGVTRAFARPVGLVASLVIGWSAISAGPDASRFGPTDAITIPGLERHLRFIASDALEGREALSPGFRAAAEYLVATLDRIGATPAGDHGSYLQHVAIRHTTIDGDGVSVTLDGERYRHGEDFLVRSPGRASAALTYAGAGWRRPPVAGEAAVGPPLEGRILVVTPESAADSARGEASSLPDSARAVGAVGLVEVAPYQQLSTWSRDRDRESRGTFRVDRLEPAGNDIPTILAGPRLVTALFRGEPADGTAVADRAARRDPGAGFALAARKQLTLELPSTMELEDTTNVIAVIPGSDPELRHEYVALGAHLDHIGRRRRAASDDEASAGDDDINNGADDDGSGVVALLQMAEAVAAGPHPRRSLLFVWHTGEEEGSWGAQYFTAFPTVPLQRIVAQLNVDMIGRSRAPDDRNPLDRALTEPNEMYVVGSRRLSRELGDVCQRVARSFSGMTIDYTYDAPDDPERIYERSDHYEYARKGIPVAFFFTGLHADYHKPSDEVGRIDFAKLQRVARTVLATAWTLANAPGRPRLDASTSTR